MESEIIAHEPLIEAVTNLADRMVSKQHPAESEINDKLKELSLQLQELKQLTAERKLKLLDAVESHTVINTLIFSFVLILIYTCIVFCFFKRSSVGGDYLF